MDGLERDPNIPLYEWDVIPYHRNGFQALKQGLLFEKLIPQRRKPFDLLLNLTDKVKNQAKQQILFIVSNHS